MGSISTVLWKTTTTKEHCYITLKNELHRTYQCPSLDIQPHLHVLRQSNVFVHSFCSQEAAQTLTRPGAHRHFIRIILQVLRWSQIDVAFERYAAHPLVKLTQNMVDGMRIIDDFLIDSGFTLAEVVENGKLCRPDVMMKFTFIVARFKV